MADPLVAALGAIVGPGHVLADPELRAPFETDWTGRLTGRARIVVRPADTAQVAAVLRACHAARAPVVPQGGNTGLAGGSVPRDGEVVLSLVRLRDLGAVDPATALVEAGAGVTLTALQEHARAAGLDAGVDLAARDSATVGGLAACDAGGLRALRHGTVRRRITAVEAVLADGAVLPLRAAVLKDNAGFALPALLVGSEGALGIITRVRWRLEPLLAARAAALVPVASVAEAAALLGRVRPGLPALEAAELLLDDGLQLVLDHLGTTVSFARAPAYVLLECAAAQDPLEELAAALAGHEDAVVATGSADRARLWQLREAHTEAIAAAGRTHKLDVGVPLAALGAFCDQVREVVANVVPGGRLVLFGHLADGNVHVNVLGAEGRDDALEAAVLALVADCGGTISAEHGVGREKARWLHLVRAPADIAAMRAVKAALDPDGLLHPGCVLA